MFFVLLFVECSFCLCLCCLSQLNSIATKDNDIPPIGKTSSEVILNLLPAAFTRTNEAFFLSYLSLSKRKKMKKMKSMMMMIVRAEMNLKTAT